MLPLPLRSTLSVLFASLLGSLLERANQSSDSSGEVGGRVLASVTSREGWGSDTSEIDNNVIVTGF